MFGELFTPLTTVSITLFNTYSYAYIHTHTSRFTPIILAKHLDLDVLLLYFLHGLKLISCGGMLALGQVLSYTNLSNWFFFAQVYEHIV